MKKIINTSKAPAPIGPYNQAVLKGGMLFTSGQIAIDPQTGELDNADISSETIRVMENLKAVLAEANFRQMDSDGDEVSNQDEYVANTDPSLAPGSSTGGSGASGSCGMVAPIDRNKFPPSGLLLMLLLPFLAIFGIKNPKRR